MIYGDIINTYIIGIRFDNCLFVIINFLKTFIAREIDWDIGDKS